MTFITTIAAARRVTLASMLIATLASCGGGGGGSAAVTPAPTPTIASFLDIVAAPGFLWSTAQQTPARIVLSRSSGLGNLTLLVSHYVCDGSSPNPVRGSLFTSFSLTPAQQAAVSATVDLAALTLQVPAAAATVLVEVVDNNRKIALYSKLVTPAALATLAIQVPDAPALASCAAG